MTNYKELVKQRTSIPGYIEEVERFETWWNKNLATVISYYDGYYRVFLLVYDPIYSTWSPAVFPTDSSCSYWGEKSRGRHSYSSDARSEANWLREELTYSWRKGYDNPILIIHPYSDCSRSFSELVKSPYVKEIDLPFKPSMPEYNDNALMFEPIFIKAPGEYPSNPSDHLKPLDIVKVKKVIAANKIYHLGIYLGDKKICHFSDPTCSKKSTDNTRVRITSWDEFMGGWHEEPFERNIVRVHPIVPFRHHRTIAKNIVWDEANSYGYGRYCLANNNCEHYANCRVFGLNWSEQVAERPSKSRENAHRQGLLDYGIKCYECKQGRVNNGNSSFNLKDRLNSSFNEADNWRSQEITRKYEIEVPPKDNNCRVM